MTRFTTLLFTLGIALAASCGDNGDLICQPGTFKSGDDCVAGDPNDKTAPVTSASPGSLRTRALPGFVVLSSEEENVTIHYTIDGSEPDPAGEGELSPVLVPSLVSGTTIKFFGVDASGNAEATHTEVYEQDTTAPAPVTNLAINVSAQTATVTWTNPPDADYAGTLVTRIATLSDIEPTPGKLYAAPTALSASSEVVQASAATMFVDPNRPTGPVRYVAWAYDDLGNYSPPVLVESTVGTISTAATFTYDTASNALVLTSAPPSLDLTATTADLSGTDLTLHLSVKNVTATVFQAPKILITGVTNATLTGADGNVGGTPFENIGPGWFAPAQTKTKDLTFTGAASSTVVTINLDLGTNPIILTGWHKNCCSQRPHGIIDTGSVSTFTALVFQTSGGRSSNRYGGMSRPGLVVGQRYYDVPTTETSIERWDMVTLTKVGGVSFAESERENITNLVRGKGTDAYAIVREGGYRNSGKIARVVRYNEALKKTGTLEIEAPHYKGSSQASISPDGNTLALPAYTEVWLVDLATFTLKDVIPATTVQDNVETSLGTDDSIRDIAWLNDSSGFVVIGRSGGISVVALTAASYTETKYEDRGNRGNAVETLADGRVWIAKDDELVVYTPGTGNITTTAYPHTAHAMTQVGGELWVLRTNRTTVDHVGSTGAVVATTTLSAQAYGHWMTATKP